MQCPKRFRYMSIPELLSNTANFGLDKLYLLEQMNMRNDYIGHNTLGAGYLVVSLPFSKLGIYAGVRFEHNNMELVSNTKDTEESHVSTYYKNNDFFPSLNANYRFDDKNQMRASYGRSINRPEFREVSSSVYYDFDLASNVQGNPLLKSCYIDNIDLRYEYYPSKSELISVAAFYKHFDSPIEWTYTVAGGTDLIYSYKNAKSANSYGIELDIKKSLDFIGLPGFSWSFNGSLIKSKVNFEKGAKKKTDPCKVNHHTSSTQVSSTQTRSTNSTSPCSTTESESESSVSDEVRERHRATTSTQEYPTATRCLAMSSTSRHQRSGKALGIQGERTRSARPKGILQAICRRHLCQRK